MSFIANCEYWLVYVALQVDWEEKKIDVYYEMRR